MNLDALNAPAKPELSPEEKRRVFVTVVLQQLSKLSIDKCVNLLQDNPECLSNAFRFVELVRKIEKKV